MIPSIRVRLFPSRHGRPFELSLDRRIDGLLNAGPQPPARNEALTDPEQFALSPLLEVATELRSSFEMAPSTAVGRAELMARLHWTPQQRRSIAARASAGIAAHWHQFSRHAVAAALATQPRRFAMPAGAFVLVLVMALALRSGGGTAAAATLSILEGRVEVQTAAGWAPLLDGAPVSQGDRLRLPAGSAALLTFVDGSVLQLGGLADIEVTKASFEGTRELAIDQRAGRLEARIPHAGRDLGGDASFTLAAPGARIEVAVGAFAAEITPAGTRVDDVRGRVVVHREPPEAAARATEPGPAAIAPAELDGAASAVRPTSEGRSAASDARDATPEASSQRAASGPTREDAVLGALDDARDSDDDTDDGDENAAGTADERDNADAREDRDHRSEHASGKDGRPAERLQTVLPPFDERLFPPAKTPTPTRRHGTPTPPAPATATPGR